MNRFLQYLDSLNRKERFFLYTFATGNSDFTLSPAFREQLGEAVDVVIPPHARAYIDYHLDWLHAASACGTRRKCSVTGSGTRGVRAAARRSTCTQGSNIEHVADIRDIVRDVDASHLAAAFAELPPDVRVRVDYVPNPRPQGSRPTAWHSSGECATSSVM